MKQKEPKKIGRPSKYNPERVAVIVSAIEEGHTEKDAAKIAGIDESLLSIWKEKYPEFDEAVKKAHANYQDWILNGIKEDAKKSLKTLICGLEYEEIKREFTTNKEGQRVLSKEVKTNKRVLPNVTAIIFALCNRDPENWKNRVEGNITGKVDMDTKQNISLASVPDELLEKVIDAINGK